LHFSTGGYAARGFGGVAFVAMTGWDLYDHQRTVSQNTPVMQRLLSDYFDQLESLVLNDSQCGIPRILLVNAHHTTFFSSSKNHYP
jgi:hypothetical protein